MYRKENPEHTTGTNRFDCATNKVRYINLMREPHVDLACEFGGVEAFFWSGVITLSVDKVIFELKTLSECV